ncbi:uncharacterized protein K452DRAFT_300274 [Aplosporella prunicola CBS 121167]|uniref:BZIP domain-containing protein n=1 Tax=Aplosporella prunicola CBS 121167 TaxID=1176127 RepID=A0A6A6B6Y1_9PEZI|nr:uncharacterized protein K452DRAFT_300274 [Aplosporella prunicola CBS 121167]KAF2139770.1 hypothetical protein K452DRAFT_300274 [Aplosporella prunicola CBS 121167]
MAQSFAHDNQLIFVPNAEDGRKRRNRLSQRKHRAKSNARINEPPASLTQQQPVFGVAPPLSVVNCFPSLTSPVDIPSQQYTHLNDAPQHYESSSWPSDELLLDEYHAQSIISQQHGKDGLTAQPQNGTEAPSGHLGHIETQILLHPLDIASAPFSSDCASGAEFDAMMTTAEMPPFSTNGGGFHNETSDAACPTPKSDSMEGNGASSLEARMERMLEVIEELGFENIDVMTSTYYTADFQRGTLAHLAQAASRRRRLRKVIATLHSSSQGWGRSEAQGYHDAMLRSAEHHYTQELLRHSDKKPTRDLGDQVGGAGESGLSDNPGYMVFTVQLGKQR